MGGMKDEINRITIPPLFPRVHVNDTARGGVLSQPFNGKTMSMISKHHTRPSPANIFDPMKVPIVRSSETDPQANTDLSLQFRTSSSSNASDCSVIDSLFGMSASSYDAVKVTGDKKFWKMRTYMINQQKIFAWQVFELHRLIMVQKMIANSPNLILESKLNGGKHGTTKSSHWLQCPKLPLPSIRKELVNQIRPQQQLPPPGNQWLVPVMSPIEGLVYKPYAGPCPPPSSAFMVPVYGQDSLDTASRFSVSTQLSQSYFPPANTRTTVNHTNPFGQFQRLSSTSSHMTQDLPLSFKKSQECDDSEVHGSTASTPPEKHKLDLLPLFPTEPIHKTDEYKAKQQPLLHAIKAIPHNPKSATESAIWIFHSIQEERRTQII